MRNSVREDFADQTMRLAHGKWVPLLMHAGIGEEFLRGKNCPCPVCGGKDRFRFINKNGDGWWMCNACGGGDGMDLLMAYTRTNFKKAAEHVRSLSGGCVSEPPNRISTEDRKRIMTNNVELWKSGVPKHELLVQYLEARGLRLEEFDRADLRLVPHLDLFDDDKKLVGRYPAMLARIVTRDGKVALIHRTYLINIMNGLFTTKKKMTSSAREWKGGCVRLFASGATLIVAEGIETALSVRAAIYRKSGKEFPCWATTSAQAMENLALPEHVKHVIIAADNDENYTGQKAAYALAHRLALHDGRGVKVLCPEEAGTDFNDKLRSTKWKGIK